MEEIWRGGCLNSKQRLVDTVSTKQLNCCQIWKSNLHRGNFKLYLRRDSRVIAQEAERLHLLPQDLLGMHEFLLNLGVTDPCLIKTKFLL